MIRKARAVWHGIGRAGSGNLTTDSGVLSATPYSLKTRFENEKGTNPGELIAAAHAGCFTMALAFGLHGAGFAGVRPEAEIDRVVDPKKMVTSYVASGAPAPARPEQRRTRYARGAARRDHGWAGRRSHRSHAIESVALILMPPRYRED
jgi:lipoyl-dependent peroxiredoxin